MQTKLRPISPKRKAQLNEYKPLTDKLRSLCKNRSEISGKASDWRSDWLVVPHHIRGRIGKRLLNPFNIVMITNVEHDYYQAHMTPETKDQLEIMVRLIRIKQGFKENGQ